MTEEESLTAAIVEQISILPFQRDWAMQYREESSRLWTILGDRMLGIEHFGSTAVPGLCAKPVIDILVGVRSISEADSLLESLCRNQYVTSPEFNETLADRRWLMRHAGGKRTHHLHLVVHNGEQWQRRLRFRDLLRDNQALAERYGKLKQQLETRYRADREAYTAAKSDFVSEVLGLQAS